jgi:hypothetical protein
MDSWAPVAPELFDGFRERRTRRQRMRSAARRLDVTRQRLLVTAARMARPITSRLRG